MPTYQYFPARYEGPIRTLLLDANVTAHLDTIARKGTEYADGVVNRRMADLVRRLDADARVLPGLGEGEGVMRRAGLQDVSNYRRRSENAQELLAGDRSRITAWLEGEALPDPRVPGDAEHPSEIGTEEFEIVRENLLIPSYAVMLKAYQLYLQGRSPESGFRVLAGFAEELFARGSREVLLGALLLAGNHTGREMALNIMKLREQKDLASTLDALWNTSFDLTHSRVATMPSLPEFRAAFEVPCVFVTDDRHLGRFLQILQPAGAMSMKRGGGITGDHAYLKRVLQDGMLAKVVEIVEAGNDRALNETTDVEDMARIRRYRARAYADQLEEWLAERLDG